MSLFDIALATSQDTTVTAMLQIRDGATVDIRPVRALAGWGVTVEWNRHTGEYLIGEHRDDRPVRLTWADDSDATVAEVRRIIAANTPV